MLDLETAWNELIETRKELVRLRGYEGELNDVIAVLMSNKTQKLETGVTIKRSRTMNRKWDGPALIGDVARRAAETELRGSYSGTPLPEPLPAILGAVVQNLRATLAVSYGRMGELEKIGIDADEYSEKSYGSWKISALPENDTSVILDDAKKDE